MKMLPATLSYVISVLLDALYGNIDAKFQVEVGEIGKLNRFAKGNNGHVCFSFRGADYGHQYYERGILPFPVPRLGMQLRPRMVALLEAKEDMDIYERPCIKGYLRECLRLTENYGDIQVLLPDTLHYQADHLLTHYSAYSPPIAPAKLQEFQLKYPTYPDLIRRRLAMNLLFAGID